MASLRDGATVPTGSFPLLPLRNGVIFPGTSLTLPIGRERSVALARELHRGDVFGVVTQQSPSVADPGFEDLHPLGTFVRVAEIARLQNGDFRIALEGVGRMRLTGLVRRDPYWLATGEVVEELPFHAAEANLFAAALEDERHPHLPRVHRRSALERSR
jgi:ATP-dependent Lon protease